jgi:hypothetical protein
MLLLILLFVSIQLLFIIMLFAALNDEHKMNVENRKRIIKLEAENRNSKCPAEKETEFKE